MARAVCLSSLEKTEGRRLKLQTSKNSINLLHVHISLHKLTCSVHRKTAINRKIAVQLTLYTYSPIWSFDIPVVLKSGFWETRNIGMNVSVSITSAFNKI